MVRDADGEIRAWGEAYDRSVGRMLVHIVERDLPDDAADACPRCSSTGRGPGPAVGAARARDPADRHRCLEGDERQARWLAADGFERVRRWWQMSRPVSADEAGLVPDPADFEEGGVRFLAGARAGSGPARRGTTCARCTTSSRAPSSTTSTQRGRRSTSSSSGSARTPVTGGTTGGWPSSPSTARVPEPVGALTAPCRRAQRTGTAPTSPYLGVPRRPAVAASPRARCHDHRRRRPARARPRVSRRSMGLPDRGGRPLHLDGLGRPGTSPSPGTATSRSADPASAGTSYGVAAGTTRPDDVPRKVIRVAARAAGSG